MHYPTQSSLGLPKVRAFNDKRIRVFAGHYSILAAPEKGSNRTSTVTYYSQGAVRISLSHPSEFFHRTLNTVFINHNRLVDQCSTYSLATSACKKLSDFMSGTFFPLKSIHIQITLGDSLPSFFPHPGKNAKKQEEGKFGRKRCCLATAVEINTITNNVFRFSNDE